MRNKDERKVKGYRGMKTQGKLGRRSVRARLMLRGALITRAILCVWGFFFNVGILCVCVSSTWDASTRAAEQTKVLLFFPPPDLLYPVDIVLWILLKQRSTETLRSGEEWGVCSPSSQCEAEPITQHNASFWETLGCF